MRCIGFLLGSTDGNSMGIASADPCLSTPQDSAMLLTFGAKMSSNVTQWLHARLSDGGLSITDLATLAAIIEEMSTRRQTCG